MKYSNSLRAAAHKAGLSWMIEMIDAIERLEEMHQGYCMVCGKNNEKIGHQLPAVCEECREKNRG